MKRERHRHGPIHLLYLAGMTIKGIDGVVELLSGILLALFSNAQLTRLISAVTRRELLEDPHDFIAGFLVSLFRHFSLGNKHFAMVYLTVHGLVKIFLVVQLLRRKTWAFPIALCILGILVLYQLTHLIFTFSPLLAVLTAIDIGVICMIWIEYRDSKGRHAIT